MEQVFFIADFHLGDHDVFTKDENGRRMNVNIACVITGCLICG